MKYETLELLIDGKWTTGTSDKSQDVINPATEQVLGTLPHASTADLNAALAVADKGFQTCPKTPRL
ncbi:MAG: aldehyde dehydrogenase family protein [Amylibacter sp.]|nr:aldehyde dehydrogenase family protein [Amylibacter sp.]